MNFFEPVTRLIRSLTLIIGGGIGGLLLAVGTIVFFWSVIMFLVSRSKGDAGGMKDAGNRLLLSAVGLFFMVAVWGIVRFLEINILGNQVRCVDQPQTIFGQNGNGNRPSSCGGSGSGSSNGFYYYDTQASSNSSGSFNINSTGGSGLGSQYQLTPSESFSGELGRAVSGDTSSNCGGNPRFSTC